MKKFIALMLCLIMAISLVACGGNETTGETGDASVNTELSDTTEKGDESENTQEDVADNNDKVEKLIIEETVKPENAKLSDSGTDYETYIIENITYQEVMNYESKLIANGFNIQRGSFAYPVEADNLKYEIQYQFQYTGPDYISSHAELENRVAQGKVDEGNLTVTVKVRDLGSYNLPQLPRGKWRTTDNGKFVIHNLNSYENCSQAERVALAKGYVDSLKTAGYTINTEEHPEGKEGNYVRGYIPLYYYYAEDANNNSVEVIASTKEDGPYTLAGVDDWAEVKITLKRAE